MDYLGEGEDEISIDSLLATMHKRALIIEDDQDIANLIQVNLRDIDCEAEIVGNGIDGLYQAIHEPYDIIILDIMLPSMDGMEVCQRIRQERIDTPIIMLTSKAEEIDKVLGLNLGADDYMTKPFSVRELVARVKARIRRYKFEQGPEEVAADRLQQGGLTLDILKHKVLLNGEVVELTAKEFDLLKLFMQEVGRTFTREELLSKVWGYSYGGYEHTVNSHINRLRLKIEQDPANPTYILTVWGVGYKFNDGLI
ncbi:response regulator transcription factor [Tunicatimonas pelagia]|uniref:response regulator transcription factor n=1 Tax=Tunicatimonas pelagia TaxID=931531 RepID=UPI002666DD6E|nr:response regulator transcription factor [Tunicatimonas pelagia]WKN41509.1 response regulator transcription factor [Tunicatimonas pelagia]